MGLSVKVDSYIVQNPEPIEGESKEDYKARCKEERKKAQDKYEAEKQKEKEAKK